jgi:hypothetical protein
MDMVEEYARNADALEGLVSTIIATFVDALNRWVR